MTSIADMQWVLHHLPNKPVTLEVRTRGGGMHTFATESGWKKSDISWRGSLWSVPPKLSVWAPRLPDNKRQARGVEPGQGAMEVKWINRKQPGGAAAFSGGLREGDVIIEADGKPIPDDPNQFQMYIKLNHKVGDTLSLTVLRNRRKQPISVKLVH